MPLLLKAPCTDRCAGRLRPSARPFPCAHPHRCLGLLATRIVYVESIARTRRFSLSAKILYKARIADMVFVQWEQLAQTYPRAIYKGRLY